MRIEDQRGGNGSVPGTRRKAVPIAMATGPAEYTAGQQELPVRLMVNALECERVLPSNASICADYPKGWPFPPKRLATSTTEGSKFCLIQKFVLGLEKRH